MNNLELGHLKHPAISNYFSLPSAQINPINLELLLQFNKETQSLKEVSRPFIPKMNPKAEKCVGDNSKQSQTDWNTDTVAEWDVCWFVGSRCALFDIWCQPHYYYLKPLLSQTISWYHWEFKIAGFYCVIALGPHFATDGKKNVYFPTEGHRKILTYANQPHTIEWLRARTTQPPFRLKFSGMSESTKLRKPTCVMWKDVPVLFFPKSRKKRLDKQA